VYFNVVYQFRFQPRTKLGLYWTDTNQSQTHMTTFSIDSNTKFNRYLFSNFRY